MNHPASRLARGLLAAAALTLGLGAAADGGQYGEPMPAAGEAIPLADAIAAARTDGGYTGKIRGRITEVCRKKGCFMVLADEADWARVTFLDYGFFVPKDTQPGSSTVYGELSVVERSQEEAEHFAADAGRDGGEAGREYTIVASSVVID